MDSNWVCFRILTNGTLFEQKLINIFYKIPFDVFILEHLNVVSNEMTSYDFGPIGAVPFQNYYPCNTILPDDTWPLWWRGYILRLCNVHFICIDLDSASYRNCSDAEIILCEYRFPHWRGMQTWNVLISCAVCTRVNCDYICYFF